MGSARTRANQGLLPRYPNGEFGDAVDGQGGRGVDYGFAAAISVFIFLIIAGITMINFRFSRQLEQVSENL